MTINKMRAIVADAYGNPEVLKIKELENQNQKKMKY